MLKKKIMKGLCGIVTAVTLVTSAPVGSVLEPLGVVSEVEAASSVKLSKKSAMLVTGEKYTLKISGVNSKNKKKVKWKSSNNNLVVSVGKKDTRSATLTARKSGNYRVTATYGKKTYTCSVRVVGINKSNLSLVKGKKGTIKLYNTKGKATWKSSNKNISVKVAKNGKSAVVTAKKVGDSVLTIKVDRKTFTCRVVVSGTQTGSNDTLTPIPSPTVVPSEKVDDSSKPSSDNTSTDKPNVDKPNIGGEPSQKPSNPSPVEPTPTPVIPVNPVNPTPSDDNVIKVDHVGTFGSYKFTLMVGETFNYGDHVKIYPENATEDKTILFETSDPSVATVDSNGVVTAIKAGSFILSAYPRVNRNYGAGIQLKVVDPYTDIYRIYFNEPSMAAVDKNIGVGETRKIIDYVVNAPGNGGDQNYIFKSSDTSILRVDQSGNLTGCGTGFATISITSKYPNENGDYVSASTTYHVGEYDDATIMKYLVRDKQAEKEFMDRINQERVNKGYQPFQYTAYGAECSMVRALYNIFNNIKNPLTTPTDIIGHGGSQNSHGGYATYKYTSHREGYGTEIANGLLSSPPHYINNTSTTRDTKYAWCVVLRYYDPAGVGFSVMIETFNGLYSDEEQDSMWSESTLLRENGITCSLEPEVYVRYKSIYDTYGSLMTVY